MFTKIKEFLFGKPSAVEAPYKIETPAPTVVEPVPVGTEASIAAVPVAGKPLEIKAEPKPPAKPKTAPKPKPPAEPKAAPKPKSPRNTVPK